MKKAWELLGSAQASSDARCRLEQKAVAKSAKSAVEKRASDMRAMADKAIEWGDTNADDVRWRVMGALDGAGIRSAPAYLTELNDILAELVGIGLLQASYNPRNEKRLRRALKRGKGVPKQAVGIRVKDLIPADIDSTEGRALVAAIWQLLREIEVSAIRVGHVRHVPDASGDGTRCMLDLPVSKTDVGGTGASRRVQCWCGKIPRGFVEPISEHLCPRCCIEMQLDLQRAAGFDDPRDFLFSTETGAVLNKASLVKTWSKITGIALQGHSPRVGGACHYVVIRFAIWQIQFLARWGSVVILDYVREAWNELLNGSANSKPSSGRTSRPSSRKRHADVTSQRLRHPDRNASTLRLSAALLTKCGSKPMSYSPQRTRSAPSF